MTTPITIRARTAAVRRAQDALADIITSHRAGRRTLGRAREYVNAAHTHATPDQMWAAVQDLESLAHRVREADRGSGR